MVPDPKVLNKGRKKTEFNQQFFSSQEIIFFKSEPKDIPHER